MDDTASASTIADSDGYYPNGGDLGEKRPLMASAGEKRRDLEHSPPPSLSFDDLLDRVGVGLFHVILTFISGWALASDSVEVQCVSFVAPQLDKDPRIHPTPFEEGALDAIIFVGMMVGGYVWGSWSDVIGRRTCLITSLTFNGVFGIVSGFSPNYVWFLVFRFFSGVGVGGSIPVAFSYFCEFFTRKTRGPFVIILAAFWALGQVFASLLALVVIGNQDIYDSFQTDVGSIKMVGWRIYVILCTFPCLTSAFLLIFLPESPSFLYTKGKLKKASSVLRRINKVNNLCTRKRLPDSSLQHDLAELEPPERKPRTSFWSKVLVIFASTRELFTRAYIRPMGLLLIIWFTFSFGYYGLLLWFPEYFKCIEEQQNSCFFDEHDVCVQSKNYTQQCNETGSIYLDSVYTSLATIPGTAIGIFTINLIGARLMLAVSIFISGLSTLLIKLVPKRESVIVILSCVFSGVSVAGWNALDVISTSELFPVHVRSTAIGVNAMSGRLGAVLGNLAFGELITVDPFIPIVLVAVILIAGGLVGFLLPSPPREGRPRRCRGLQFCRWLKRMVLPGRRSYTSIS